jgi:response regulator RpfG family c-di-GMP phosphodiesterase
VQDALDELRRERGKHFDPAVVDAFMTLVDDLDPLLFDGRAGQETFV